jgi:hypothetical protein
MDGETRSPMRVSVSLITLACFAPVATGCLSHEYVIPKGELGRLAAAPPETRGAHVRVVQQIGSRRGDPIPPDQTPVAEWTPAQPMPAPSPPPPEDPPPPEPDVFAGDSSGELRIEGSFARARRADLLRGQSAPANAGWRGSTPSGAGAGAGTGWRGTPSGTGAGWHGSASPVSGWHGTATPSGGGGGGHGMPSFSGGGGGGGSDSGEVMVVIAVIAIVIVAAVAVGLVGAEGVRFDGYVQMSPAQPVHLKRDGGEIVLPLGELTADSVAGVDEALVMDDEGYGFRRLEHPLDRKGLAFKLDAGTVAFAGGDNSTVVGPTAHFQVGAFFTNNIGALITGELGGATDRFGATLSRHSVGIELQGFWLNRGPIHLGTYVNGGRAFSGRTGENVIQKGPRIGGGLLAELDLTGRMALMLRAGGSAAELDRWSSDASGTIGLAVY